MTDRRPMPFQHIASRDNPLVKTLRKLAHDPAAYRKHGQVWIEGDHLCRAALARGWQPQWAVLSHSAWHSGRIPPDWYRTAQHTAVLDDALLTHISALESSSFMGYLLPLKADTGHALHRVNTLVLDRVQDPGNVGSMLRSASALGFKQIVALKGTTALWSGKVLRAGMGAHFDLQLHESADESAIDTLLNIGLPLLVTHLRGTHHLHQTALPTPCAWVMGHEGQGVADTIARRATHLLRIAQPGGEESLNVAAATAICLHASATAYMAGVSP